MSSRKIVVKFEIELPEDASVKVESKGPVDAPTAATVRSPVERYFNDYLSDNGRWLYKTAAEVEQANGTGYTLEDVADAMGVDYGSALSYHRTTGRTAKRWGKDTASEAPVRLIDGPYEWDDSRGGMRTQYRLPDGVADEIAAL